MTCGYRDALAPCYRSCLELAAEHGLESVAFCRISTGEFHFPNREAAEIVVHTVMEFLRRHQGLRVLFLELGVGGNTPGIIKYPFWKMAYENPNAAYVCINFEEAFAPCEIERRALCMESDIGLVLCAAR